MKMPSRGAQLLKHWLHEKSLRTPEIGRQIGVNGVVPYRWLSGDTPKLQAAFNLEALTDGFVPARSWLEAPESKEVQLQK
jgi:hypothetical protein